MGNAALIPVILPYYNVATDGVVAGFGHAVGIFGDQNKRTFVKKSKFRKSRNINISVFKFFMISFICILLGNISSLVKARAEILNNRSYIRLDIVGTYGDWIKDCGINCSHGLLFNGLIVRRLERCLVLYFEAIGVDKDYTMMAAAVSENNSKVTANEEIQDLDIKTGRTFSKFCKVVFEFTDSNAKFVRMESDKSMGCTASSGEAAGWLQKFHHRKVSNETSIPTEANRKYIKNVEASERGIDLETCKINQPK